MDGLSALLGLGLISLLGVIIAITLLPSAVAFKLYTKTKNWKIAFKFAIWYALISMGLGWIISMFSLGLIGNLITIIAPIYILTRGLKKYKVKSELKLLLYVLGMELLMTVLLFILTGAAILSILT